jgi:hypothetical protein
MVWMAGWWLTEAVDIEATALLPIVTFPLLGIEPLNKVLPPYAADVIFLFMGGFIIGLAVERMQNHPGANIALGEFERIAASLLVVRCARYHGEETLNLMVLKTQPERIATIRRMAALPGSGVRPDQVLAIAQAFEKLLGDDGRDGAYKNTDGPAVQPRR